MSSARTRYHYPSIAQVKALKSIRHEGRSILRTSEMASTKRALIRYGYADAEGHIAPRGIELLERLKV